MSTEELPSEQGVAGHTVSEAPGQAAGTPDRALAQSLLQQGLDCYDREDLEQAYQYYIQALEADPTFTLVYNNLGMVLIDTGQYPQALEVLNTSIGLDPGFGEAYNNLGFVLRRMNQDVAAAAAYTRFLELEPEVEEGARIRQWIQEVCTAHGLQGAPDLEATLPAVLQLVAASQAAGGESAGAGEAEAEAQAATAGAGAAIGGAELSTVQPGSAAGTAGVATPLTGGAPSGAGAAAEPEEPPKIKRMPAWEAVMAPPATAAPINAVGEYVQGSGPAQAGAAEEVVEFHDADLMSQPEAEGQADAGALREGGAAAAGARTEAPQSPATAGPEVVGWVEQGLDAFAEGDLSRSEELFRKAIAAAPDFAEAHTGLGKVLVRREEFEEGLASLSRAVALDPSDPAAFYVQGFALRSRGRDLEAAQAYSRFLALVPEAEDGARIKSWIEEVRAAHPEGMGIGPGQAEPDSATVAGEGAEPKLAVTEPVPQAAAGVYDDETEDNPRYKKALGQFQEGDLDDALRACVKLLTEDPGHFRSRVLVGRIYLRQKQYEQAVEQLEGALVSAPDYPEALYFLGQAYEKGNQPGKAQEAYRRCVEVAPSGPRADQLREWLKAQSGRDARRSGVQAQCEMCLRLFAIEELSEKDGKKTCASCLALISGIPLPPASREGAKDAVRKEAQSTGRSGEEPAVQAAPPEPSPKAVAPPRRRSRGMLLATAAVVLVVGLAVVAPYLPKSGGQGDPGKAGAGNGGGSGGQVPPPPPPPPPPGTKGSAKFDPKKVRVVNEPVKLVLPLSPWQYQPQLAGLEGLAQDTQILYELKRGPEGMKIDSRGGEVTWRPLPREFDVLAAGVGELVEIQIKGLGPGKTKSERFSLVQSFTLHYQFGYLPGKPLDLGLRSGMRVAWVSSDLNRDGLLDLALVGGAQRRGLVQACLVQRGLPLVSSWSAELGGEGGAVVPYDWDGDQKTDLLVCNWYRGQVQVYLAAGEGRWVAGPSIACAPGPVALAVADLEGDQQPEVAVLSGVSRSLQLFARKGAREIMAPVTVPLSGGGPRGWVFPWLSEQRGPGFLALLPLDAEPFQFISWEKGRAGSPVASPLGQEGVVAQASLLHAGPRPNSRPLLAVLVNEKDSEVRFFSESNGRFQQAPEESPVRLDSLAIGMGAGDLNQDGLDDLAVVFRDRVQVFLRDRQRFLAGPDYRGPGMLEGALAFADLNGDRRTDLLLLDEARKVQVLLSREVKLGAEDPKLGVLGLWPGAKEALAVEGGDPLKHPAKNLWTRIPKTYTARFALKDGVDLEVATPAIDGELGRLEVSFVNGPPKPMDEAALKALQARHKLLEWVGKPIPAKLGAAQAVRVEALTGDGSWKVRMVWYVIDWGKEHVCAQVLCPDAIWGKARAGLESCVYQLRNEGGSAP